MQVRYVLSRADGRLLEPCPRSADDLTAPAGGLVATVVNSFRLVGAALAGNLLGRLSHGLRLARTYPRECAVLLDDHGVSFRLGRETGYVPWDAVEAVEVGGHFVFIRVAGFPDIPVPRHAFAEAGLFREFAAYAHHCHLGQVLTAAA
jgi:hypothetical protein